MNIEDSDDNMRDTCENCGAILIITKTYVDIFVFN